MSNPWLRGGKPVMILQTMAFYQFYFCIKCCIFRKYSKATLLRGCAWNCRPGMPFWMIHPFIWSLDIYIYIYSSQSTCVCVVDVNGEEWQSTFLYPPPQCFSSKLQKGASATLIVILCSIKLLRLVSLRLVHPTTCCKQDLDGHIELHWLGKVEKSTKSSSILTILAHWVSYQISTTSFLVDHTWAPTNLLRYC